MVLREPAGEKYVKAEGADHEAENRSQSIKRTPRASRAAP